MASKKLYSALVSPPGCSSCSSWPSIFNLLGDVVVLLLGERRVGPVGGERAERAAGEQDNPFQSPVVEEEVEGPEGPVLSERI